MSRPIKITDSIKAEVMEEVESLLSKIKMSEGELTYSKTFKSTNENAVVYLTPAAYAKTIALVTTFSREVGWHGTVSKVGEKEYLIEDIYVYPQMVSGFTTNTDQSQYTEWLYSFQDDLFSKMRMQGHSHVNMQVTPSQIDLEHREKILGQLEQDMFYIFMIWNKSLEINTLIYDLAANILYENEDITVRILGVDTLDTFLNDAFKNVKIRKEKLNKGLQKKRNNVKFKQKQPSIFKNKGCV